MRQSEKILADGGASGSHAERAYSLLEERIVTLALAPGAWITEQELAAATGLGRTPVREAVQRLVADGLMEVFPRRGLRIAEIDPVDLFLALDVRATLERMQASDAALRAKPQERKEGAALARALRQADATDLALYLRLDSECDDLLARAAGNPFAARALAPLKAMSRRGWVRFAAEQGLGPAAGLHAGLLDAVVEGAASSAADRASELVEHVRAAIRGGLAAMTPDN